MQQDREYIKLEQLKNSTFSREILYFYNQHFINFLNSSKTMEEVTEKIYCCDKGDNDNALVADILAGNNRKDDWSPIAVI